MTEDQMLAQLNELRVHPVYGEAVQLYIAEQASTTSVLSQSVAANDALKEYINWISGIAAPLMKREDLKMSLDLLGKLETTLTLIKVQSDLSIKKRNARYV